MLQGLEVSVLGLFITFTALGVFILIMIVLQRLFPPAAEEPEAEDEGSAAIEVNEAGEQEAVVAAITAALSYFRSRRQIGPSNLGSSLREGRGGWWTSRRAEVRHGMVEKR
jgi:sodium pump decarboxylase gamma subunit